jgi:hypothetical protein
MGLSMSLRHRPCDKKRFKKNHKKEKQNTCKEPCKFNVVHPILNHPQFRFIGGHTPLWNDVKRPQMVG